MHGQQELAFQVCVDQLTCQETQEAGHKKIETKIGTHMYHITCAQKLTAATTAPRQQNIQMQSNISGVHMIGSQKKSLMYVHFVI
jgi:hypothetical protein